MTKLETHIHVLEQLSSDISEFGDKLGYKASDAAKIDAIIEDIHIAYLLLKEAAEDVDLHYGKETVLSQRIKHLITE